MLKKKGICLLLAIVSVLVLSFQAFAYSGTPHTVTGTQNYLAVRDVAYTSEAHEIGKLHNGDVFYVEYRTNNNFAYGCTAWGQYGFVNGKYLSYGAPSYSYNPQPRYNPQPQQYGVQRRVTGVNNYLGLRTTPTRNDRDEIGRLYNGQYFTVLEFRNDGFAYGIAPNGQYGYVVSGYLR